MHRFDIVRTELPIAELQMVVGGSKVEDRDQEDGVSSESVIAS